MRIVHANAPLLDAPDAPRVHAQQEDVAGEAFDREVLVDRSDDRAVGLSDDGVGRRVRDGAAGCDGSEPRAPPAADASVDAIAMQ